MTDLTNDQTESLLSRFATISQRIRGTGAPGMYEWIYFHDGSIEGKNPIDGDWVFATNPQACLAGCVMWAMEVAEWAYLERKVRPCTVMVKHTPESWADEIESIADAIGGG